MKVKGGNKTMKITRRQFLKSAAIAGVGLGLPLKFDVRRAYPFAQSPTSIPKFINSLPGLGATGIPFATKTTTTFAGLPTDVYNLRVREYTQLMDPALPGPTPLWGYADINGANRYLGGGGVATKGTPVLFNLANQLPNHQI